MAKSKKCMQACQALFCLKKWFLMGHRHLGTSNGHFVKWHSHLQKRVSIRFLNFVRSKLVIYQSGKVVSKRFHLKTISMTKCHFMWCRNMSTRALVYRVHQMSFYCKTWCFGSVGLVQNIFSKVFFMKAFS